MVKKLPFLTTIINLNDICILLLPHSSTPQPHPPFLFLAAELTLLWKDKYFQATLWLQMNY